VPVRSRRPRRAVGRMGCCAFASPLTLAESMTRPEGMRSRSEPPGGGDRLPGLRRAVREAGRMRVDGEREKESPAKSVTTKAGPAFAEPPGVQPGRPPTATRRTAEFDSAAPPQRGEHKRRGPPKQNGVRFGAGTAAPCQARLPARRSSQSEGGSSRARSLGAEGLACRVLFLSHAA